MHRARCEGRTRPGHETRTRHVRRDPSGPRRPPARRRPGAIPGMPVVLIHDSRGLGSPMPRARRRWYSARSPPRSPTRARLDLPTERRHDLTPPCLCAHHLRHDRREVRSLHRGLPGDPHALGGNDVGRRAADQHFVVPRRRPAIRPADEPGDPRGRRTSRTAGRELRPSRTDRDPNRRTPGRSARAAPRTIRPVRARPSRMPSSSLGGRASRGRVWAT